MNNVSQIFGDRIQYCDDMYGALDEAEALVIVTEWSVFRSPEFEEVKKRMRQAVLFDGRNVYEPAKMKNLGFTYFSIGRP